MKQLLIAALIILLFLLSAAAPVPTAAGDALTAQDIVANCARAMGGIDKIERVKTLRIYAVYPDHGETPLGIEIKRPNLSYSPKAKIAFDGKRACWLEGTPNNPKPEMIDPVDLADFDVEIAQFFPAFFDTPSEYAGSETFEGRPAHKLRMKLPQGAVTIYTIDAETWLPVKISSQFVMRGRDIVVDRVFSDFRNVGGILYPHAFTYPARDRKSALKARVTSVEFNAPLDDAHFKIPDGIK